MNRFLSTTWYVLAALAPAATGPALAAPPPNDAFAQAVEIRSLPFHDEIDAREAGLEPGEPKPPCAYPGQSVWYRLPPMASPQPLAFDTFGSGYDTALTIWSGEELAALQHAACNDDVHGYKIRSRIRFTPQPDRTYYIQVSAPQLNGTALVLNVQLTAAPATLSRIQPFETQAADGTLLKGHVYLPVRPGKKRLATVLELSPYWNTLYISSTDAAVRQEDRTTLWRWLAPYLDAGFAVALVNMRGSGLSGGCMQWGGPLDRNDAARVVETLATQHWSNGTVGMIGLSFPGWATFMAAAEHPRALKAIVPMSGAVHPYRINNANGVSRGSEYLFTQFNVQTRGVPYASATEHDPVFVPPLDPWREAACAGEYAAYQRQGTQDFLDGSASEFWRERDLRPRLAGTDVAVLATTGFNDGHLTQFDGLWDLLGPDKRFLMGRWPHDFPTRDDFTDMAVAWFDHYLRGGPQVIAPGVVEYQDARDAGGLTDWHEATRWPPLDAGVPLYLSSAGRLVASAGAVAPSTQTFASTGLEPIPHHCPGVQALYVSPPLAEDIWLAGSFDVALTFTSNLPDGNVGAGLYASTTVSDCSSQPDAAFGPVASSISQAVTDLRHRGTENDAGPFPTDRPIGFEIRSTPLAKRVRRGERLILAIAGGPLGDAPNLLKPVLTVHTGAAHLGSLKLPVAAGTLHFQAEAPAPATAVPPPGLP